MKIWSNPTAGNTVAPGGAINLNELTDVVISTPQANQVLKYDGSTFINGNLDASNITSGTIDYVRLPNLAGIVLSGDAVPPYIESITPAINSLAGSQNITITGEYFTLITQLVISGVAGITITDYQILSPNKITFAINKSGTASGTINIVLSNGINNNSLWVDGIKTVTIHQSDLYFNLVSILLKCDGENNSTSIIDSASENRIINRFGDAKILTAQSKYNGSSLYFDGSGDYITTAVDPSLELIAGDFTLESWIYPTSVSGTRMILSTTPAVANVGYSMKITNGYLGFESGGGYVNISMNTNIITINTWHHVAISKTGNNYRFSVNGNIQTIVNNTTWTNNGTNLHIGSNARLDYAYYFAGYIDSLRISKGIARYSANFNPETDTYLN